MALSTNPPMYTQTDIHNLLTNGSAHPCHSEKDFQTLLSDENIKTNPFIYDIAKKILMTELSFLQKTTPGQHHWQLRFDTFVRAFRVIQGKIGSNAPLKYRYNAISLHYSKSFGELAFRRKILQESKQYFHYSFFNFVQSQPQLNPFGEGDQCFRSKKRIDALMDINPMIKIQWEKLMNFFIKSNEDQFQAAWEAILDSIRIKSVSRSEQNDFLYGKLELKDILLAQEKTNRLTPLGAQLLHSYDDLAQIPACDMFGDSIWDRITVCYVTGNEFLLKKELETYVSTYPDLKAILIDPEPESMYDLSELQVKAHQPICYEDALAHFKTPFFEEIKKEATKPGSSSLSNLRNDFKISKIVLDNRIYYASQAPEFKPDAYFDTLIKENIQILVELKEDYELHYNYGDIQECYSTLFKQYYAYKYDFQTIARHQISIPNAADNLSFITRQIIKIKSKSDGLEHTVVLIKLRNWADQSPPDLTALRYLHHQVEQDKKQFSTRIMVNCMAGEGRTGTFLLFHHLASKLHQSVQDTLIQDIEINVMDTFFAYHKYRKGINTPHQLAAVFGALKEEAEEYVFKNPVYTHPVFTECWDEDHGDWALHFATVVLQKSSRISFVLTAKLLKEKICYFFNCYTPKADTSLIRLLNVITKYNEVYYHQFFSMLLSDITYVKYEHLAEIYLKDNPTGLTPRQHFAIGDLALVSRLFPGKF